MKIYFGFTVAGDRSSIGAARKIVAMLQEKGHEVLTEHLVHDNAWSKDRLIPAQQVYQRDMKWLEQCDLFLAEVFRFVVRIGLRGRLSARWRFKESDPVLQA
jgi:hypothetical protein